MANYANLLATIAANIYTNGNQEVTAAMVKTAMNAAVASLGAGYQFMGIATPSTNPGTPDQNVFYLASTAGTYANFGGLVLADGEISILKYNGTWTKDVTGAASLKKVNQLGQDVNAYYVKKAFGKNIFMPEHIESGVNYNASGGIDSGGSVRKLCTDYFPVEESATYTISKDGVQAAIGVSYMYHCFYDAHLNFISAISADNSQFTTPANAAFVRFSMHEDMYEGHTQVEKGNTATAYVPPSSIDGIPINVTNDKLSNMAVSSDKIQTFAVYPEKTNLFVYSTNLYDKDGNGINNKYLTGTTGEVSSISSNKLKISPYIPVTEGKTYWCNNSAGPSQGYAFYNAGGSIIAHGTMNGSAMVAPAGAVLLRVTIYMAQDGISNIVNEGDALAPYVPYMARLKDNRSSLQSISMQGQEAGKGELASMTSGASIELTDFPNRIKKQICFSFGANITSFSKLLIGQNILASQGCWAEIDSEKIWVKAGTAGSVAQAASHGLTITDFIKVTIYVDNTQNCYAVINSFSGYFRVKLLWVYNHTGNMIAKSDGSIFTDAKFSATCIDFRRPVWAFGDSYFGLSALRWPYFMREMGYFNFLISGLAGDGVEQAYPELQKCLKFGTPKYILWCLGMNNGDPDLETANTTWLDYTQKVLSICKKFDIVPILATIPNTPAVRNEAKNAWIKASGYRYIDFAKAVHGETFEYGVDTWYGAGTENDYLEPGATPSARLHPTELGAKALATQVLMDFPELMQYGISPSAGDIADITI